MLATVVEPMLIVWDDVQHVQQAAIIRTIMHHLLEPLPETIHFVILPRQEPALILARWHIQGQVARLGEADLAFSAPEMRALARARGSDLDKNAARMLVDRTEGWIAPASLVLPEPMNLPWSTMSAVPCCW